MEKGEKKEAKKKTEGEEKERHRLTEQLFRHIVGECTGYRSGLAVSPV